MLARIRKAQQESEGGFTLIELLVVIIIIGILAAIAIPVFLNQREKGYDAQAKSDVRNIATLQETFLTDNNEYAATLTLLEADLGTTQTSANTSGHATVGTDATSFTVSVTSDSNKVFCWDSTGVAGQGAYDCTPAPA
jgi:type IV pilus assembly protein PilA